MGVFVSCIVYCLSGIQVLNALHYTFTRDPKVPVKGVFGEFGGFWVVSSPDSAMVPTVW